MPAIYHIYSFLYITTHYNQFVERKDKQIQLNKRKRFLINNPGEFGMSYSVSTKQGA